MDFTSRLLFIEIDIDRANTLVKPFNSTVGKHSHALAVWMYSVFRSIGVLDSLNLVLADLLDSAVVKDGLFLAVWIYVLFCAVYELYLFAAVLVVELDLVAAKAIDLYQM